MPEIEVNIEIYCARCRNGLCSNATVTQVRRQPCFQIEPCEKCADAKYDEGYNAGLAEGRAME